MLRWFPRLQVDSACFSCSPPDLNFLDPYFIFMYMHNNHCHRATAHLQSNILLLLLLLLFSSYHKGNTLDYKDQQVNLVQSHIYFRNHTTHTHTRARAHTRTHTRHTHSVSKTQRFWMLMEEAHTVYTVLWGFYMCRLNTLFRDYKKAAKLILNCVKWRKTTKYVARKTNVMQEWTMVCHCWLSTITWADSSFWGDQNKDGKAKSVFKM